MLLLRELGVLFYGNELFIGSSLGAWLAWVGLGSRLGQKIKPAGFPLLFALLGPLIPLEIVLIRLTKLCFGFGMLAGPLATVAVPAFLLLPIGFVIGAIFSTGSAFSRERLGLVPAQIYFYESAGAVVFGVLYTVFIAGFVPNYTLAIILNAAAVLVNVPFLIFFGRTPRAFFSFLVILFFALFAAFPAWDKLAHKIQWNRYELLAVRDSRFANLVLTRTGSLTELFENGLISSHFPDPQAYEEIVHLPLLAHKDPGEILIMGSAAAGELTEILKHSPRLIDHPEIDPVKIALLECFLGAEDRSALKDPRVRILFTDSRVFLKKSKALYDVILLNLPEPSNAQINRFYTAEFFREAAKHLRPHGLLALSMPSSENYLPSEVAFFNRSVFRTLETAFRHISIIPGQSLILLGHQTPLEFSPEILANRYRDRGLRTVRVVPSYFPIKLDKNRIDFFHSLLTEGKTPAVNRDFAPVSYLYLWNAWLLKFRSPAYFLALVSFVIALAIAFRSLLKRHSAIPVTRETTAIFFLGFSGMVHEILLLLAFQAIQGYLYWQIGFLFALFMAGLAFGSAAGKKNSSINAPPPGSFFRLYAAQAVYGILAALLLPQLASGQTAGIPLPAAALFYFLMLSAGFIPGFGFAVLSHSSPAGGLYAADLWGGALGASITSLFLVPLLGLTLVFWLVAFALLLAGAISKLSFPHSNELSRTLL